MESLAGKVVFSSCAVAEFGLISGLLSFSEAGWFTGLLGFLSFSRRRVEAS